MPEKFTCDICNKKYTRKDNMRYHILETHSNNKKECKYCNKKMRTSSIKRHMKYACTERKKILKAKKKKKNQTEKSPQIEQSLQSGHLIYEDIYIPLNDPFISPNEHLDVSLNDLYFQKELDLQLNEFLTFH